MPGYVPVFGQVLALRKGIHTQYERWARQYGGAFYFWMGKNPVVVLTGERCRGPVGALFWVCDGPRCAFRAAGRRTPSTSFQHAHARRAAAAALPPRAPCPALCPSAFQTQT